MTLLEIVKEFCRRTALSVPLVVAASQDDQLLQIMGLLNEGAEDLTKRQQWTTLQREVVFTSVAGENQGQLHTLAPAGFQWIINDTIYDRTQKQPIYGPVSSQNWAYRQALPTSGPSSSYRIRGGALLLTPGIAAGHTLAFEHASNAAVYDNTGIAQPYKRYFTNDTDTFLLDEGLALAWLRWRWKSEKGLRYAEDFRAYEVLVAQAAGHDGTKPELNMGCGDAPMQPGVIVPFGNWSV